MDLLLKASVKVGKEGTSGQLDQFYKFKDPEQRKFMLLVDGEQRIDLGSGEHNAGLSSRNLGSEAFGMDREIREEVVYTVPLVDWLRICKVNKLLEGRFGKKQFKIDNPKKFAAIKDMTSRTRP